MFLLAARLSSVSLINDNPCHCFCHEPNPAYLSCFILHPLSEPTKETTRMPLQSWRLTECPLKICRLNLNALARAFTTRHSKDSGLMAEVCDIAKTISFLLFSDSYKRFNSNVVFVFVSSVNRCACHPGSVCVVYCSAWRRAGQVLRHRPDPVLQTLLPTKKSEKR